ncbi:uncharacterized protein C8orf48 homolog [Discoglossus pictus]
MESSSDKEELSAWSRPVSRSSSYYEDSFQPITDDYSEPGSTGSGYSDESFESVSNGSSKEDKSFAYTAQQSEQLNSADIIGSKSEVLEDSSNKHFTGKGVIGKWIEILENQELEIGTHKRGYHSKNTPVSSERKPDHGDATEKEREALRLYCSMKIRNILHPKAKRTRKVSRPVTNFNSPVTGNHECIVPHPLLNRVHLENLKETMKQVGEIDVHQPSTCLHCHRKQSELAKAQFLRIKKNKLEACLLEEKMEKLIYGKDTVTCIGEIHQSLPRLSDDRSTIWQRLYESGLKT